MNRLNGKNSVILSESRQTPGAGADILTQSRKGVLPESWRPGVKK